MLTLISKSISAFRLLFFKQNAPRNFSLIKTFAFTESFILLIICTFLFQD